MRCAKLAQSLLCLLSLLFISFSQVGAQSLASLDNNNILRSSMVAYKIIETKSGETKYNKNEKIALAPASVCKLITSATAIELLGEHYTFKTQFGIDGEINNEQRVLVGNLIIKGGGDPTLGSEHFGSCSLESLLDSIYQSLKKLDINTIAGNVLVDLSIYDKMAIPSKWTWEDIGNYYGAGSFALSVCENTYRVCLQSPSKAGSETKILSVEPSVLDINDFENNVVASDGNSDNAYIFGSYLSSKREIFGTIPKGRNNFCIKGSIGNPPIFFAEQVKHYLQNKGIDILGKPKSADSTLIIGKHIYTHVSPNLARIIKELNHTSSNLIAEHLVKQIAYEKVGLGSTNVGIELIMKHWNDKGLDTEQLTMIDGSGLSRFNAITTDFFVALLQYMHNNSEHSEVFKMSLPDGQKLGFTNTPKGHITAKSGTLSGVRCYGGYYKSTAGTTYTFTFLVNNFKCSPATIRREIEKSLKTVK
ncbi:MAG: D-alanyl-D-alanine carboxypeptidase/D-alanyl-D-alanine-endopeptidase [Bacteroidales bacterium]